MKRVILNIDDFGLDNSINESIIDAHRHGVVTSTSLLVARPATVEAVRYLLQTPSLAVGLHLDLDAIFPYESNGHYGVTIDDIDKMAYHFALKKNINLIITEIRNQIAQFLKYKLIPSHIDGHHNVHMLPGILQELIKVMSEYGLNKVRFSKDFYGIHNDVYNDLKSSVDGRGIKYPDYCTEIDQELPVGIIFNRLQSGTTEIIVHTDLPEGKHGDWRIEQFLYVRKLNKKQFEEINKIQFISYRDTHGSVKF